jgi:PAS domain S-box-containing protein
VAVYQWEVGVDGGLLYLSPQAGPILGFDEDELRSPELADRAWVARVHEDDRETVLAAEERSRRTGEPLVTEYRFHRPDGMVWIRDESVVVRRDRGRDLFEGVISDITEEKRAVADLAESRSFISAVAASMAEGLVALDARGRVEYLNASAERMLGWTSEELHGQDFHSAVHFQRADGTPYGVHERPDRRVFDTGQTTRVEDDAYTRKDGQIIPVAYSASALMRDGEVGGVVIAFRSIAAQKEEESRARRELDTLAWVGRIRDALDEGRMTLHAQPIVDVTSGAKLADELLLRMVGRDGELVPPATFLPVAERYGLIRDIDRWVVREAARLAASGRCVAVNVSATSVGHHEFADVMSRVLRDEGADPANLILEVTETALLDRDLGETLGELIAELGCRLALDDFGTGFSGFSYLKRLPVDFIKIDMEFVRDLVSDVGSQHVVQAVVHLARSFGKRTVAEGVEDRAVLDLVAQYGVDYAQGFHLGRPAPLRDRLDC